MSDRSIAAADAHEIAATLRKEAEKCLRLASIETKPKMREGFLGLAHSYELTARSILKRGMNARHPETVSRSC
jgi:hypothetical protein